MEVLKLNETPVRTSRNFKINNIKLENFEIPKTIGDFQNIKIVNETSKNLIDNCIDNFKLTYGLNELLENQVKENANKKYRIKINSKVNKEINIEFKFDNNNINLVENIEIIAEENSKATIILKYENDCDLEYYHNGIINVLAKENSDLNIIIVNLLNSKSNDFLSIESCIKENANVKLTIVDFGGKNSISNYYSNLEGDNSNNNLNSIYLGKDSQMFDLNYIAELRGQKANVNIEVQGALKDQSKKNFKGTIDFKRGSKKSKGNENEYCMILSDKAKSIALPMLLCSEEDIEGNHSSSAGKVGEKELFYIMSRGFSMKEAMKLLVRANFNKIIENIKNEKVKDEILNEIDKRLD